MTTLENALLPPEGQLGEHPWHALFPKRWRQQELELARKAQSVLQTFHLEHAALQGTGELSGGQMKLLEAARALMGQAKLLLFDEPAAGVAPALAHSVFDHLRRMQQEVGMTLFVIEHRLTCCSSTWTTSSSWTGRVIARGRPRSGQRPRVIEAYFGMAEDAGRGGRRGRGLPQTARAGARASRGRPAQPQTGARGARRLRRVQDGGRADGADGRRSSRRAGAGGRKLVAGYGKVEIVHGVSMTARQARWPWCWAPTAAAKARS